MTWLVLQMVEPPPHGGGTFVNIEKAYQFRESIWLCGGGKEVHKKSNSNLGLVFLTFVFAKRRDAPRKVEKKFELRKDINRNQYVLTIYLNDIQRILFDFFWKISKTWSERRRKMTVLGFRNFVTSTARDSLCVAKPWKTYMIGIHFQERRRWRSWFTMPLEREIISFIGKLKGRSNMISKYPCCHGSQTLWHGRIWPPEGPTESRPNHSYRGRVFGPISTLLFDLYHQFRTEDWKKPFFYNNYFWCEVANKILVYKHSIQDCDGQECVWLTRVKTHQNVLKTQTNS